MAEIVHRTPPAWQKALHTLITEPKVVFETLGLDTIYLPAAEKAAQLFPLRVTEHFLKQIKPGDIQDPLLKQILPIGDETIEKEGFTSDPLHEQEVNPIPGLLHKYSSRVLLTVTSACAIHCRYCFRREFAYQENNPGRKGWPAIVNYIREHPDVNEVIYSGGDPLTASDDTLAQLTQQLSALPQLRRLRIHTRLPLLIPERITDEFITWFTKYPHLQPIFVLHCNHPNELSDEVKSALQKLHQMHVTLLNQTVLLKGVNDNAETLIALSERLFEMHVMPYYLHQLDRVKGTAHFEVGEKETSTLLKAVSSKLPGFLVPKLARELPGGDAKVYTFF